MYLICLFALLAAVIYIICHFGPLLFVDYCLPKVDVKKKYRARWALVTGGSSGIGSDVSTHLASLGLNVVLVAKNDEFLEHHRRYLSRRYPKQQFRAIGIDLSVRKDDDQDYVRVIIDRTKDIDIQVLFANAGYLEMYEFASEPVDSQLRSVECNTLAVVRIAHHFMNHIKSLHRRGAIVMTSSQVSLWPTPYASMYAAGKAFLTSFASALAIEARDHDIDVLVIHPGYVETELFQKLPDFLFLRVLRFIGQKPEAVTCAIFASIGRLTHRDTGIFTHLTRIIANILGHNVLTWAMNVMVTVLPDYRRYRRQRSY